MRDELVKQVKEELSKGNHILLKGRHGIGKSYIAQEIQRSKKQSKREFCLYFPFCKPPKQILMEVLEFIVPDSKDNANWKMYKRGTIVELSKNISDLLGEQNKRLILILDEIHTISANASASYRILMQQTPRVVFFAIATGQYLDKKVNKPEMKRFFWELKEIEMKVLNKEETTELVEEFADLYEVEIKDKMKQQIIKNSQGNALAIKKAVEKISKEEDPDITQHGAIKDEAVNLFPIFLFFIFILIGMKYLMRVSGDYELANISGFTGIVLFFCLRFLVYRKSNN